MTDPTDPHDPELEPFPTTLPTSPFPPVGQEMSPADPPSDWNAAANAHDLSIGHETAPRNPLVTLGRFAFPPAPAPDEEGIAARERRWTSRAIIIVAVLMLVFNAASIQNWSRQQPPGWITGTVQQLSDVWATQLTQLGADRPRQAIRDAWTRFQRVGLGGRDRPEPPAP